MTSMRAVGDGHPHPSHARVREDGREYVVELDVWGFTEDELTVEALGPLVTVRGDQLETKEDEGLAFRLHERLEESFRLPADADAERLKALYRHGVLEIRAPRSKLESRAVPIEHASPDDVSPDAVPC